MLSKQAIEEFKKIYFEEYGEKLTDEKAIEQGQRLLNLMKVIYRPITKSYGKPNNPNN